MISLIPLIHIYHVLVGLAQQHASVCRATRHEYLSAEQQKLETWHNIGKTNKYDQGQSQNQFCIYSTAVGLDFSFHIPDQASCHTKKR